MREEAGREGGGGRAGEAGGVAPWGRREGGGAARAEAAGGRAGRDRETGAGAPSLLGGRGAGRGCLGAECGAGRSPSPVRTHI